MSRELIMLPLLILIKRLNGYFAEWQKVEGEKKQSKQIKLHLLDEFLKFYITLKKMINGKKNEERLNILSTR